MKIYKLSTAILILLFITACKSEKEIESFSVEKPYAIEIRKERSLYQAEKLANRLIEMGLDAYMVQHKDTIEGDGEWYYILHGNVENQDSAKTLNEVVSEKYNLQDYELEVVKYQDFENAVFKIDSLKEVQEEIIVANNPDIKEDVYNVMEKFPESNALFIDKGFVINTPNDPSDMEGFDVLRDFDLDLPRGVSRNLMLERTTAFAEVIYQDNLYGDKVTIDIGKLRKNEGVEIASIINKENKSMFEIAEEYADLVLNTGDYLTEEKEEISVSSYTELYGYKVTIEPAEDYFRTYMILVDKNEQYILFCQSTDKTDEEIINILTEVGKGEGLLNYNEFYNTFYTIPDNMVDNDIFIGFTIDKVGWSYAEVRGHAQWANEIVGHWTAVGHFFNEEKGNWVYGIFDLLTPRNQNYVYGNLYSSDVSSNMQPTEVYNTDGFVIYETEFNWDTWESYETISEINFGVDRYVCHVNNRENSWFDKEELIERAEALQFKITDTEDETDEPVL